MSRIARGRTLLVEWRAKRQTDNWFKDNKAFTLLLNKHGLDIDDPDLSEFGKQIADPTTEALVARCSKDPNTPQLHRYSPVGERIEQVAFDPSYRELGKLIYGTGVMGERDLTRQGALVMLSAHHGEAGHNCPLACTQGMIRIIERSGHDWLKKTFLPGLLNREYGTKNHLYGSQFLTEIQGGSDVGANACTAKLLEPESDDKPAMWAISGEKWFCSVVDAPVYLMTARPEGASEGTKGLGVFLVPRQLPSDQAQTNHFTIRRLKEKMGTRAMASGEIDWNGSVGYQVGKIDEGFLNVVNLVLNCSRIYNALNCAGMQWRAFYEARGFAEHREAFGQRIDSFDLVKHQLSNLYTEALASTVSTFDLISVEKELMSKPSKELQAFWRFGLNINKYWTSVRATQCVRTAMEVFGGNGTIEDFSPLPRLYRDCMVTESWEGTHNTLTQQVQRDISRYQIHKYFIHGLRQRLRGLSDFGSEAGRLAHSISTRLDTLEDAASTAIIEDQVQCRQWIDSLCIVYQSICLIELGGFAKQQGSEAVVPFSLAERYLLLFPHRVDAFPEASWPSSKL